jgi:hypothetical protein
MQADVGQARLAEGAGPVERAVRVAIVVPADGGGEADGVPVGRVVRLRAAAEIANT